jgi:uncharacterized protein involved in oxidation of intracellular sulfur
MALHGVEASEYVPLSNMKFLYEQVKLAEKIVNF